MINIKELLFYPTRVALVSTKHQKMESIITISLIGIPNFEPPMISISLKPHRFSYSLIKQAQEFVVNIPTEEMIETVIFCGKHSGKDYDKWKRNKLTRGRSQSVETPFIEECPINIECKLKQIIELGSHHLIIGKVTNIRNIQKLKKNEYPPVLTYIKGKYVIYEGNSIKSVI